MERILGVGKVDRGGGGEDGMGGGGQVAPISGQTAVTVRGLLLGMYNCRDQSAVVALILFRHIYKRLRDRWEEHLLTNYSCQCGAACLSRTNQIHDS